MSDSKEYSFAGPFAGNKICGPSPFLGTAVSLEAASATRLTSTKKKNGRKKEGDMAN
jgi:hypothetical protein